MTKITMMNLLLGMFERMNPARNGPVLSQTENEISLLNFLTPDPE